MSLQVLSVLCSIILFVPFVVPSPSCDLSGNATQSFSVDFTTEAQFDLKIVGSNNSKQVKCIWDVSKLIGSNSALVFWHNVLDMNDSLEIVDVTNTSTGPVFNLTGSISPGILPLPQPHYRIVLTVQPTTSLVRVFDSVLYNKSSQIEIGTPSSGGWLEFPKSDVADYSFSLQPSNSMVESKLLIIFDHLPASYSLKVDNISYSQTSPPPKVIIPNDRVVGFELTKWPKDGDNKVRISFWNTIANCSKTVELDASRLGPVAVAVPAPDYTERRQLSLVSCNTLFNKKINSSGTNLMVKYDVESMPESGLLNELDQLDVMSFGPTGTTVDVVSGRRSLHSAYSFYGAEQLLVAYNSFQSSPNPSKFVPPTVSIITHGGYFDQVKTDKTTVTNITLAPSEQVVVVVARAENPSNRVYAKLADKDGKPLAKLGDGVSVKVYGLESVESVPLLTVAGPVPSRLPSDTAYIRIELHTTKQAKPDTLRLELNAIEPGQFGCYSSSVWASSFELNGTLEPEGCTWLVAGQPGNQLLAVALNYVSLPGDTTLEMVTLERDTAQSRTIFDGPKSGAYLPDLMVPAGDTYEFRVRPLKQAQPNVTLELSRRVNYLQAYSQNTDMPDNFRSPNYPGAYPVNLDRVWAFEAHKASQTLLTWLDVDLAKDHSVSVMFNKEKVNVTGPLNTLADMLIPSSFFLSLNASSFNGKEDKIAGRGFNLNLTYYSCGGEVTLANGLAHFGFNSSSQKIDPASPRCLWTVVEPLGKAKQFGDRYLELNVSLKETDTKAELVIMDSISIRPDQVHHANLSGSSTYRTSLKYAIIIYDMSKSPGTKKDTSVWFTVKSEECKKTEYALERCLGHDRCITDWMACNGLNECGDWSDEIHCSGSRPVPPAPVVYNSGVNGWVVVLVLMPLGAVLGIIGYIYVPIVMRRFRQGRYSEFRSDFSEVH